MRKADIEIKRVLLSWSSGKDSAWALYQLFQDPTIEVVGLATTFTSHFNRSAIHGVRRKLLHLQSLSVGLPLVEIPLPWPCSNDQYEALMAVAFEKIKLDLQIDAVAFGDLFLEDIRQYRIDQMKETKLELIFPLWLMPTDRLAREMIAGGLKASVTCLDPKTMPEELAGAQFSLKFLQSIPKSVDPCGENGEFHTFAWDGPMFKRPIPITSGAIVRRNSFVYADLLEGAPQ